KWQCYICSSRRRHTRSKRDWSSDVCSSDLKAYYEQKEAEVGEEELRELERVILLRMVDTKWMDHIDAMDQLKQGIGLRAMGQQRSEERRVGRDCMPDKTTGEGIKKKDMNIA